MDSPLELSMGFKSVEFFFFFFREKLMYLSPDPENEKKGRSNTQGWQRESYPKF